MRTFWLTGNKNNQLEQATERSKQDLEQTTVGSDSSEPKKPFDLIETLPTVVIRPSNKAS